MGKERDERGLRRRPAGRSDRNVPAGLTHLEAIERAAVMDTTALSLCMENGLPIYVFELAAGNILRSRAGNGSARSFPVL